MRKNTIVAFCGIDGSGKTSNLNAVYDNLVSKGIKVKQLKSIDTEQEYFIKILEAMKEYEASNKPFPMEMFAIILATELIKTNQDLESIKKQNKYDVILIDRWIYSHMAFAKSYEINTEILNCFLNKCTKPDLVFVLDASIDTVINRIKQRAKSGLNENRHILTKARAHFFEIANKNSFEIISTEENDFITSQAMIRDKILNFINKR